MCWLLNAPIAVWRRCLLICQGLSAAALLANTAIGALLAGSGPLLCRPGAALTKPGAQRQAFALLRLFQPNLVLGRRVITAYANNGTAVVTRRADVIDVLSRDDDFGVVYGPRMEIITGGENFFLGMQDTPSYTRDVSNMRLVVRRDDVNAIVKPFVEATAASLVAAAPGKIDVPQALSLPVAARLLDHYFGMPGPSEQDIVDWTTMLFWYLFIDLKADPALDMKAAAAAIVFREWVDAQIAARKASGEVRDDVLGRCLAMQAAGLPGMRDRGIRDNLIGLLIGELPTTSAAANLALDELLDRPEALAGACAAARAGDDAALAAHVFEALRFRPLNPVIYRRALRDSVVAEGTLRACHVAKDTMVLASNLSAMFDPLAIPHPNDFRIDRPWEVYMLWGYGLHSCFGAHLNRATIPGILKPLLARQGLRRASGNQGRIDKQGTPFPVHFNVVFDA
jgi:cytochrome P450